MASGSTPSIIVLGESDVGKSHYLAQVYLRLLNDMEGAVRLRTQPRSLSAVNEIASRLAEGCSGAHTPAGKVTELALELAVEGVGDVDVVIPDYAGEQIRKILTSRSVTSDWARRVSKSGGWLLFIRIGESAVPATPFTVPASLVRSNDQGSEETQLSWSRGAEIVELLQILLHARGKHQLARREADPVLGVILTCWDELRVEAGERPMQVLERHLPLVSDFLVANWAETARFVLGLSSTEGPLDPAEPDEKWRARGPEKAGFTILADGSPTSDLTVPLRKVLLAGVA